MGPSFCLVGLPLGLFPAISLMSPLFIPLSAGACPHGYPRRGRAHRPWPRVSPDPALREDHDILVNLPDITACHAGQLKEVIIGSIFSSVGMQERIVEAIYADYSISMTEFKKNPASVLRDAGTRPVAVLNHNRPAFYMVTPEVFEALVEELSDRDLLEIARRRLMDKDKSVEVDIDAI
ncbi:type II toxin-antitoxin system Phd/YefM family antitoxin [Acidithiobacillus sp. MC6.1]|nr:type II toxin-antitoxin system Phd/YefM family antitoxin [Acidithiobacillus sp. MC6.1]